MGLRVAEDDSGSGEHDLLNDGATPASPLLIDHNLSAGTVREEYTPGLDERDGSGGALHLMGVDALGTVRALFGNAANASDTDTFGTFAYGIPRTRTGSDAFSFAFAGADGYRTDPNGLLLLGNRVYHPYTGRFLTRDPAGAGDNDYEYCENNPLSYTDPLGLDPPGVTDHPGPPSGLNQWFSGDTFDITYAASAGSGTIVTWWYNVVHGTNGRTGISAWEYHVWYTRSSFAGWNNALGFLGDFLTGRGSKSRSYGPTSTQARDMMSSLGYSQVLAQIVSGKKSGDIRSLPAFKNTVIQLSNGTQAQLGAFHWTLAGPTGVDITNDATFNSFVYHIPEISNKYLGTSFPTSFSSGPMGTIHQTIHINFP